MICAACHQHPAIENYLCERCRDIALDLADRDVDEELSQGQ